MILAASRNFASYSAQWTDPREALPFALEIDLPILLAWHRTPPSLSSPFEGSVKPGTTQSDPNLLETFFNRRLANTTRNAAPANVYAKSECPHRYANGDAMLDHLVISIELK